MNRPRLSPAALAVGLALVTMTAPVAAAGTVSGTFTIDGEPIAITDVSAERLEGGGDEAAWRLVFSERPHEHTVAGREKALDGESGLAFTVELLADGEGHLFVIYRSTENGHTFPHSFPWPQVTDLSAGENRLRGRVGHNQDFGYDAIEFTLDFDAPLIAP